jgi:hypothetical protein
VIAERNFGTYGPAIAGRSDINGPAEQLNTLPHAAHTASVRCGRGGYGDRQLVDDAQLG